MTRRHDRPSALPQSGVTIQLDPARGTIRMLKHGSPDMGAVGRGNPSTGLMAAARYLALVAMAFLLVLVLLPAAVGAAGLA